VKDFAEELNTVADMNKEELIELISEDMKRRNISKLDKYFSEVLISLQKSAKSDKKTKESHGPSINKLVKHDKGLLFKFDDSQTRLLKGFTIDIRIFFNLLRKIVIVKLNADKIWTRQFYSQDLKKIFVVLKPLDAVIENRAMVGCRDAGRRLPEADRARLHRPALARAAGRKEQAIPHQGAEV
jgi:uncharacterized membrane protein